MGKQLIAMLLLAFWMVFVPEQVVAQSSFVVRQHVGGVESRRDLAQEPAFITQAIKSAGLRGIGAFNRLSVDEKREVLLNEAIRQGLVAPPAPAVDWRSEFLDAAARKGRAEDRITGNFVNEFNRVFDTGGSLKIKARVLKSLPEKGCKRIEVTYQKAEVWMPTGRSDATFKHLIDHCVTVGKETAKAAPAARR